MNALHCTPQPRCAAAQAGVGCSRARIAPPGQRIEAACRQGAPAFDL